MNNTSKKIIRRMIAFFIAVILVAGIGLTHGSDRVLYATELDENEYFEEYYDDSVYEEPAYEEEYVEEAVYDEAVEYVEPAYEEPVYEEPAYEEPAYEEPAQEEYAEPAPEVSEEPVYEEPVYEEPVYEEPVQAEEQPLAEVPAETPRPETWLNGYTSRAEISAYAPEGALPEGSYMVVTELADDQVLNTVQTIAAREVSALHGVSIKFYDANGAQVIPEKEVQIGINAYGLAGHEAEERSVLALDYYGNGYIIDPNNAQIGLRIDATYAQFWAYGWNNGDTYVFASFKDTDEGEEPLYTDEAYSEGYEEGSEEGYEEGFEAESEEESEGPKIVFMEEEAEEETEEESPAAEGSEEESEGPRIITMEEETEEESAEEESTEEEPEEVSMPAMEFDDVAPNGIIVHVSAEEGVFPEGTVMVLSDVAPEEVMGAVEGAVEGEVVQVLAVDITFIDKDGNEIQPESGVAVSLSMPQAQTTEEVAAEADVAIEEVSQDVIHIDTTSGEAEILTDATVSEDGTGADFVAEHFTIYGIAVSVNSDAAEAYKVQYKVDAQGDSFLKNLPEVDGQAEQEVKASERAVVQNLASNDNYDARTRIYNSKEQSSNGWILTEFIGWEAEDGTLLQPGDIIVFDENAEDIYLKTLDENGDHEITLTSAWDSNLGSGGRMWVTFYLYNDSKGPQEALANGGTLAEATSFFTTLGADFATVMNAYRDGEVLYGDQLPVINNKYTIALATNLGNADAADSTARSLATDDGVQDSVLGVTWKIGSFPSDADVFKSIDASSSSFTDQYGQPITELDTTNYRIQWVSVKHQNGENDGWHIDGRIMSKKGYSPSELTLDYVVRTTDNEINAQGDLPVVDGEVPEEHTAEEGSIQILGLTDNDAKTYNTDTKLYISSVKNMAGDAIALQFIGWQTENGTLIKPNESLEWDNLVSLDGNYDGIVTLTSLWSNGGQNARATSVNFFINSGNLWPKLDSSLATVMNAYGSDGELLYGDKYPNPSNSSPLTPSGNDDTKSAAIKGLSTSGLQSTKTPYTWCTASFPTDEAVFAVLSANYNDLADSKGNPVELKDSSNNKIPLEKLSSDYYEIKWTDVKFINNEGWHIDGKIVKKPGVEYTVKYEVDSNKNTAVDGPASTVIDVAGNKQVTYNVLGVTNTLYRSNTRDITEFSGWLAEDGVTVVKPGDKLVSGSDTSEGQYLFSALDTNKDGVVKLKNLWSANSNNGTGRKASVVFSLYRYSDDVEKNTKMNNGAWSDLNHLASTMMHATRTKEDGTKEELSAYDLPNYKDYTLSANPGGNFKSVDTAISGLKDVGIEDAQNGLTWHTVTFPSDEAEILNFVRGQIQSRNKFRDQYGDQITLETLNDPNIHYDVQWFSIKTQNDAWHIDGRIVRTDVPVEDVVVTITGKQSTVGYDGKEHSVSGYDVDISNPRYTEADFTFSGTAKATRTDAGTTNMGLAADQFENKNPNFGTVTFTVTDGYQAIVPVGEVVVTITGHNNTTDYNGKEHSVSGYDVAISNPLYTEADFSFSGTAETKRTDAGTTNMGLAADQFANTNGNFTNVTFNVTDGYQTIEPIDVTVTVTGANNTTNYDGEEHSVSGYTATANSDLYDVNNDFTFSGRAEAARTDAGTTNMGLAADQFANTNGNFANVTFNVTDGFQTITKRTVVMTSATDSKEYNGSALTNDTVTVSGDGFIEGEGATYNVTGTQTLAGSSSNSFTYTLNEGTNAENYTITQQTGTLTVSDRTEKYVIVATGKEATAVFDGQPHTVTGFDMLAFEFDGNTYTVTGLTAEAEGTDAGDYQSVISGTPVITDAAGNDVTRQFTVSTKAGTLTIQPRPITLTSASDEKLYDGTPLTNGNVTVSEPGFVGDDGATYDVTGSQMLVGTCKNTFTYTLNEGTKADNYRITKAEGELTIMPRDTQKYEITIQALSDGSAIYDGTEHTISGFETLTFTVNGQKYTVEGLSAEVKGTDAGVYTAEVTGEVVVRDAQGNNVTEQFIVKTVPGKLTINKRNVILTSGSAEKVYEEEPLTNAEVTVTGYGFVEGEGATYDVTGSQSVVGSSENTFTYTLNEGTKASNYEIRTVNGLLKVKDRDSDKRFEITVKAKSDEVLYDGNTHTVAGLTTNIYGVNNDRYKVEGLSATTTALDAGTYDVNVVGTAKVLDETGNDVTNQFIVKTVPGKLTINPRDVTLISASVEKKYDGKGLTAEEITVDGDGFVKNDGIVVTGFSSRILVGSAENLFDYQLKEGTNPNNYNITVKYGTLSVINRDAQYEIWVAAPSETYMYDGTTHTYSGVEVRLTADGEAAQAEAEDAQNGIAFEINGVKYYLTGMDSSVETGNAGTYPVNITGSAVIKDENGNEVQDQFTVHTVSGVIEVQKRHVTLTSGSVSEPYNGKVLANNQVTVTGDGFVQGEGLSYNVTGSRTIVGIGNNTFDYAALEGTDLDNYDIDVVYGTLTVTNRDAKYLVTVTAQSGEFQYDGNAHTVSGLVSNIAVVNGETFNIQGLTATATATDVGEYPVYVTGVPRVYDAQNNDVTDQFAVAANDGTLRIRPVNENAPDTYALTVRFVDEAGNDVADSYYGRYAAGEPFGPIQAPAVAGMVPDYDAVVSDANGMPANDLTLEIIYRAAPEEQPAAAGNDDQNPPVPGGPGTDGTGGTGTDGTGGTGTDGTGTGEGSDPLAVLNQTNDQGETTTLVINDVTRPDTADETKTVGPIKEEVKIEEPQSQRLAIAVVNDGQEFELFDLEDTEVPLAAPPAGYWSIVNLLMMLCTIFIMILIAAIHFLGKKDETNIIKIDETEQEARRKRIKRILVYLSPIPSVAAFILFLLKEDMRRTVTMTDKWTLLFAAILVVQALLLFLSHRKRVEDDEDEVQADF